jgi:hypothetical protein
MLEYRDINTVLGKALRVLGKADVFEPLRNLLHLDPRNMHTAASPTCRTMATRRILHCGAEQAKDPDCHAQSACSASAPARRADLNAASEYAPKPGRVDVRDMGGTAEIGRTVSGQIE